MYGAARRIEKIEPLRASGVIPLRMDVTDEASMEEGVRTVLEAEGRIDVLINNAGYGSFGAIENVSMEEARRQLEVNVFGLARLTQLVIPSMRERHHGRIVNIASVAGRMNIYFGGWYHVSKYAVESLSDALRIELKPFGINVSIIEPGGIHTEWGVIAADHLRDSSAGTPYEKEALQESETIRKAYTGNYLSNPAVVTRAICRAALDRRPKSRYRVGLGSSTLVFFHTILPDRWWDFLVRLGGKVRV